MKLHLFQLQFSCRAPHGSGRGGPNVRLAASVVAGSARPIAADASGGALQAWPAGFCIFIAVLASSAVALADNTPQPLPFQQNWSNPSQITTANVWSGVPGIVGHRGDGMTNVTAADPQTILADGSSTPINVIANQNNPNLLITGGIAEFDTLPNPVVALQGSGIARAPHLVVNLNTVGRQNIVVSYLLRDIDGAADNALQKVALHYRVGNSGNFINVPAAFVADATTGPSQATLVTPVSVTLPAAADNQPWIQIRVMTTDAFGSDEWIGIDDISVSEGNLPLTLLNLGRNPVGTLTDNGGGSFTVIGGGNDAWDNMDECAFAHREVTGDFDVKVRVQSLSPNSRRSKAGLMVRETRAEDSRMAFNRVTPPPVPTSSGGPGANDAFLAYRTGVHEPTGNFGDDHNGGRHEDIDPGNPFPSPQYPNAWLRLVRENNQLIAYNSVDGVSWFFMASQDTTSWNGGPLQPTVLVGLAVSRDPGDGITPSGPTATAEFREYHFQAGGETLFAVAGASSAGNPNGVKVMFNHPVGPSALDPLQYSLGGPTVEAVSAGPNSSTVRLTTSFLNEGQSYSVFVGPGVTDVNGFPIQGQNFAQFLHGEGYESRPVRVARNMIPGLEVSTFLSSVAYARDLPTACQDLPAVSPFVSLFEDDTPDDLFHENYSVRLSGLVQILFPGNYRFACASDDKGILYLSTDDNPANKVQIAFEPEWANARAFASLDRRNPTNPQNQSAIIPMQPGARYVEYVCAEGGGDNHSAVTWDAGSGAPFFDGQQPMSLNDFTPFRMFQGTVFFTLGAVFVRSQPQDQTVPAGATATFSAKVDGTPPYALQWYRNGAPIPGATGYSYTTPPLSLSDDGSTYWVKIDNEFSTVSSAIAVARVSQSAPTIDVQPQDQTVSDCGIAQFMVVASGDGPLTYQWQRNGFNLPGQINPTLALVGVGLGDAGSYSVVVSNAGDSTVSSAAELTVLNFPPTIAAPPDITVTTDPGTCSAGAVNLGQPTTSDECGPPPAGNNGPGIFPLGTTPVLWTTADRNGVTASAVQNVTVTDGQVPTIVSTGPNVSLSADNNCQAAVPDLTGNVSTTDNCGGVTVTQSPAAGTIVGLGDTTITFTALDTAGNASTSQTHIIVADTAAPRSTICLDPAEIRTQGDPGAPSTTSAMPRPDLLASLQGQPTRNFDQTTPNAVFVHSWDDLTECVTDTTLEVGLQAVGAAAANDTVSLGFAEAGTFNPAWSGRLGQDGPPNLALLTHAPWTPGAQEIVTLDLARLPLADGRTLDLIGLLAEKQFLDIAIANDTAVDFTTLTIGSCRDREDIQVDNDPGQPGAVVSYDYPTFTDACDPAPVTSSTMPPGSFFPIGSTLVPATSTDDSGNVGRSWFRVICRDVEPPMLQCQPMNLECTKPNGAAVFYRINARDNSGDVTVQCVPPSGTVFPIGASPVQCVAVDGAGLTAQCTFTVTLTGRLPPSIRTVSIQQDNFMITFSSQAGVQYIVEYKNSLADAFWTTLTEVAGNGGLMTVTDPVTGQPSRYYRIKLRTSTDPLPGGAISIYEPPEPPPGQPGPSDPCRPSLCGPPNVYLFSGEFHYEEVDLCIKGRGLDFVWARKYRSCICWFTPMGYAWDFSYNICIVPNGLNIDVLDGNTRQDTYYPQPDGSFTADQFFREGRFLPDGRFVLAFADSGTWQFLPLDGTPSQGRIERIADRNGNALRFQYDGFGRLANIIDTLDRNISVSYDSDGFISAVTDFTGRQMRYTHYQDGDADGSFGDLRSVTWPAVTGTPHGNNFPGGKTNFYTYSKGSPELQLNHNLLTVTDAKAQPWLQNTYGTTPGFYCDQVIRQVWGYPNETLHYSYHRQTPSASNNFAIVKAIVNDRVGNVTECYFDPANRCVLHRAFTGRATPGVPTTATANRPTGKLRSSDPDFFDTRHEWNVDSMPVRVTYPNGNSTENVYERDLNPAASPRSRGNLRSSRKLPGPLGGDQATRVELFEYDAGWGGGCCDFNFVTKHTDARGNVTLHSYDARGNRLHTQHRLPSAFEDWEYNEFGQVTAHVLPDNGSGWRRRDVSGYFGAGAQRGYLAEQIVDAGGLALITRFDYDAVGNVLRAVDPRGADTLYEVNALNQVVRETSREVSPGSGLRYRRDFFYDANNNLVREDVENRDDTGALQANTHFTKLFDYEILNRIVRSAQEKGSAHPLHGVLNYEALQFADRSQFVVTEYAYDPNRNRTRVRHGEATAGHDPWNVVASQFDERDLLFRETRAPGSALASTTQRDYDGNRNLKRLSQGLENAPRVTLHASDGYDRPTLTTDAMGNVTTSHYDANNNCVSTRLDGELTDLNGGAGNRRLAETFIQYDVMDRPVREDRAFFDPRTQAAVGDGFATTLTAYNDNSQITRVTDDRGNSTVTAYDSANRRSRVTDAKTNSSSYAYDANGNRVATAEVEHSDLGQPPQLFTLTSQYDGLDRLIESVDAGGGTNRYACDSRNSRVWETDALNHETRHAYDGLSRLVQTVRDMNGNGASAADPADIVTRQLWDDSCRLIAQTDGNSHTTRYAYDSLDRRIVTRMADGTMHLVGAGTVNWLEDQERPALDEFFLNGRDVHDNVLMTTDANGTVVTSTFDLSNRPVSKSIARAPGVLGTTFENFQYNGVSLVTLARNNDLLVTRAYDSLCHPARETINFDAPAFPSSRDRVTTWTYDGADNQVSCAYPGGRVVTRAYDGLNRLKRVCDGACVTAIAEYFYFGPARVEARCYRNGACAQFGYDSGRHLTASTHSIPATGTILDQRTYVVARDGNKTQQCDVRAGGPGLSHTYSYDAADRLRRTVVASPINPSVRDSLYTLDATGNRLNVTSDPAPGDYTLNPTSPDPADAQVNQYTATPFDSGRQYDASGELSSILGGAAPTTFEYDYRGQLIRATVGGGTPVLYTYDAFGRRVQRVLGASLTRHFHDGERELEEQDFLGNTLATFVMGRDGAELLTLRRGASDFYFHDDDLRSVRVLSDAAGTVSERYDYGDYGEALFAVSSLNSYLFAGRRYDPASGLYGFGSRLLEPLTGRFTTREPAGVWADAANLGNGYTFSRNNAASVPSLASEPPPAPPVGCGQWDAVDYCPRLAGLWGQPFLCGLKHCGTGCASYACDRQPVRRCESPACSTQVNSARPSCATLPRPK